MFDFSSLQLSKNYFKMHCKLLLYFLFLSFSFLFAQTPKENFTLSQNYIYLANLDYHNKNYKLATKRFKEGFKIHRAENSYDILNAAASGFKSGDKKFARKMIVESITKFGAPKDFVTEYEKYTEYEKDQIFEEIKINYDFYINEYYRNLKNPTIYFEVQKLCEKDQNIRNLIIDIQGKITVDKATSRKIDLVFSEMMNEVDSITTHSLIEITKLHGYQERSWIILWHQRGQEYKEGKSEFWKFFKPIIENEINAGNLHESFFGRFDDEFETRNGKQIYGFYSNQVQIHPIVDIENVDKRRKQIGLPPLLYDKLIYGTPLPIEYKLSNDELYKDLLNRIKTKSQ